MEKLDEWLATVVPRVCLNTLRSRRQRREEPLDIHVPDPIVNPATGVDPEHEALLADAVGLALAQRAVEKHITSTFMELTVSEESEINAG